jgi:hypothetical protein
VERFAKKYSWIAFHQLLGHLADHCLLNPEWRSSIPRPYDGPWQISYASDIDPTLVLRGDVPPEGKSTSRLRRAHASARPNAWWLTSYSRAITSSGSDTDWLRRTDDVPRPEPLLSLLDPRGREWIVLESHARWRLHSPDRPGQEWRWMWVRTQSSLVPLAKVDTLREWASESNWMGLWMPTPDDHSTSLVGGYPDVPPWPALIGSSNGGTHKSLPELGPGWLEVGPSDSNGDQSVPLALATTNCHQESGRDYSAVNLPNAILPSHHLVALLGAHWAGAQREPALRLGLGSVEAEYSWLASSRLVAFSSATYADDPSLLCVLAEPLRRALVKAGLGLWSWVLGEKLYWTSPHQASGERAQISGAVAMAPLVELWGFTVEHAEWRPDHSHASATLLAERGQRTSRQVRT